MTVLLRAAAATLVRGDRFTNHNGTVFTVASVRRGRSLDLFTVTTIDGKVFTLFGDKRLDMLARDARLMLTRTQLAAYHQLQLYKGLVVNKPFARRTLDALVHADLATWETNDSWASQNSITPLDYQGMLDRADAERIAAFRQFHDDVALDREAKRRDDV